MLNLLNDECLIKIFQYLELKDQMCVANIHERFFTLLLQSIWYKDFPEIDTFNLAYHEISLNDIKILFRQMAPYITKLTIHTRGCFYSTVERISFDFCLTLNYPELRMLAFYDDYLSDSNVIEFIRKCPKLEVLKIFCRNVSSRIALEVPNIRELLWFSIPVYISPMDIQQVLNNRKILRLKMCNTLAETLYTYKQEMGRVLKPIFSKITELRYYKQGQRLVEDNLFLSSMDLFENLEYLYCDCLEVFVQLHTLKEIHLQQLDPPHISVVKKVINNNEKLEHIFLNKVFVSIPVPFLRMLSIVAQKTKRVVTIHWNLFKRLEQVVLHPELQSEYLKSVCTSDWKWHLKPDYEFGLEFAIKWD